MTWAAGMPTTFCCFCSLTLANWEAPDSAALERFFRAASNAGLVLGSSVPASATLATGEGAGCNFGTS